MNGNLRLKTRNLKFVRPKGLLFSLIFLLAVCCATLAAHAQRRDHLTEKEADLVREAQELDRRTDVFVKAVERRFLLLDGRAAESKDIEKWGEAKGTKAQLLYDVSKILQEAVDNIDDAAARDAKSRLLPKAVHNLADASRRFLPQLEAHKSRAADKMEQAAILTSIEYCQQIIEAAAKVPREAPKEEKKKKNRD